MPTLAVLISLVVLAASGLVVAQIMGPDCNSTLNWSFNSLGQSPCIVAAYMLATCNDSVFVLQPLRPGNSYFVPVASDSPDFNECLCTVVAYNLLSVCDACQGENWRAWSNYSSNCVDIDPAPLSFPNLVPLGTSVPQWAVIDHTLEDNWNATKEINDEFPDIEPGFFPENGTTSPDPSTIPFDDFSSRSNTGTIAGSVAGGVAALAAIGALFYFLRKRRRSQVPSAVPVVDGVMPLMSQEHPPKSGDETHAPNKPVAPMKLYYDPNDPRTFPDYQRMSASAQDVHGPVAPKDWSSIGTKVQERRGHNLRFPDMTRSLFFFFFLFLFIGHSLLGLGIRETRSRKGIGSPHRGFLLTWLPHAMASYLDVQRQRSAIVFEIMDAVHFVLATGKLCTK